MTKKGVWKAAHKEAVKHDEAVKKHKRVEATVKKEFHTTHKEARHHVHVKTQKQKEAEVALEQIKDIKEAEEFAEKADKESKKGSKDEIEAESKLTEAMKETKLMAKWDSEEGMKAHANLKAAAKLIIKKKPAHHASIKVKAVKKVMSAKIAHELKGLKKLRKHQAEYKKKIHHDADSILKAALVKAHGKHESNISVKQVRKNMVKVAT